MRMMGLDITVERTAYKSYAILGLIPVGVLGGYATLFRLWNRPLRTFGALLGVGVSIAGYHAFIQLVHQLGHALAARASGYPMTGIRYDYIFTYSTYPKDEPPLPPNVHIQRSLGGLGGTTLMLALTVILWLRGRQQLPRIMRGLLTFLLLDSLLLFAGSVISDGGFVVQRGWESDPNAERGA